MSAPEAIGAELLLTPMAWPLGKRVRRRQRFSTQRLPLHEKSLKIDHFAFFAPHDFQVDRLSEFVTARSKFDPTFARPFRPKTDNELPSDVIESVTHNHMPQMTLRNIGRFEMSIDLEEPLPLQRVKGLGGDIGGELNEVRKAHVPKPQMAQVWSLAFMSRVRNSLRRIVIEDPWEFRYGQEATSQHTGHKNTFAPEGTHPDDMPGMKWGPDVIAQPQEWQDPPFGEPPMERPPSLQEELKRLTAEQAK
jgi:hypothetical protein